MNTTPSTPEPKADAGHVFALASRFVTELYSWNLSAKTVQAAKDQKEHPVWEAIRKALDPKPEPVVISTVPTPITEVFIPRIQILSERPKPCAKRKVDEQITDLKRMYKELQWAWTEPGLTVPRHQKGIDRLLVLADTGFTNNQLFGVCKNSFLSWSYVTDLDSGIPVKNDERHPSRGAYAIWVRDDDGPDRDLMGLSANEITARGLKTLTILERMLLELVYHKETGQHLDTRTFTLCSGSRDSDGCVPGACWRDDKFWVRWCNPGCGDPYIGARQAVTL